MLTVNIDVSDGLVNGSRGEVAHIVSHGTKVSKVLVKCDRIWENPPYGIFCEN